MDVETAETAKLTLLVAKRIQSSSGSFAQSSETIAPTNQPLIPHSMFKNTRGYLEKIVYQINWCYEHTCYDACAVMIRRLIEILIIECFENHTISAKIKDSNDDYLFLKDLISVTLQETAWHLGRTTKSGLHRLKQIGDQSAHSRRYNARKEYIDDIIIDLRTVAEELLYISQLKH